MHVAKSSGNVALDEAAAACVSGWKYAPAKHNGKPVETAWKSDVVWKISETPPTGAIHTCDDVEPSANEASLSTVLVIFSVGTDGHVKEPNVAEGSGHADFDAALLRCVSRWIYTPATRNGTPVAAEWAARFTWSSSRGLTSHDGFERRKSHLCGLSEGVALPAEGTTALSFLIREDGSTDDVAVAQSSGNADLDKWSTRCVKYWKYKPAIQDGKPIAMRWSAQVQWTRQVISVAETGEPSKNGLP